MLIKAITLEDWKSFAFAKIEFRAGTTAIIGANGAGKSSILEAIGFVLFNHTPGKLSSLLREGAKEAIIEVRLVSSLDGCEYLVERRFDENTTKRYRVYDAGDLVLAEGVAEVQGWLRRHLGIGPDADMPTLFENTIGVPQGTFTAPFLLPAKQRQAVFDPLLQVEKYKQASDRLLPTVRELKDRESALAQEIARMEGELTVLPGLREENEALADAITQLKQERQAVSQQLIGLEASLEALDAADRRLAHADHEASKARFRLDVHQNLLDNARILLDETKQAAEIAKENRPGYEAYLEAEGALGEMEASRTERDRLLRERGELQSQAVRLESAREQEQRAKQEAAETKAQVLAIQADLAQAKKVEAQNEKLDADEDAALAWLGDIREGQAVANAHAARLTKQSSGLSDPEMGRCPLCESELTAEHKAEIIARNQASIEAYLRIVAKLDEEERQAAVKIGDLQSEMSRCRSELRDLANAADFDRALDELAKRKARLDAFAATVEGLSSVPQALERLDAELLPFADLDNELGRWQARRRLHQSSHMRYLSSVELAKQRPARRAKVDEEAAQHEKLECERDRLAKEQLQAKIAYDATEHMTVKRQVSDAQQNLAASKAQLEEKEYRLGVVRTCIGQLEGLEKELTAKTAAATETTELLAMTETVREILREAGPYVTRRLVRQISQGASTIFGDLMGDPARRLEWSDDYELTLDVRGHRRSFSQLSGGEQTCAALALRLGLLHETSSIDVAFFDEPTTHLDPERRQNLAERMMQVKGFRQLWVISHDDSFESTAESSIHVVNDEAGSHVTRGVGEAA